MLEDYFSKSRGLSTGATGRGLLELNAGLVVRMFETRKDLKAGLLSVVSRDRETRDSKHLHSTYCSTVPAPSKYSGDSLINKSTGRLIK